MLCRDNFLFLLLKRLVLKNKGTIFHYPFSENRHSYFYVILFTTCWDSYSKTTLPLAIFYLKQCFPTSKFSATGRISIKAGKNFLAAVKWSTDLCDSCPKLLDHVVNFNCIHAYSWLSSNIKIASLPHPFLGGRGTGNKLVTLA